MAAYLDKMVSAQAHFLILLIPRFTLPHSAGSSLTASCSGCHSPNAATGCGCAVYTNAGGTNRRCNGGWVVVVAWTARPWGARSCAGAATRSLQVTFVFSLDE